MKRHHNQQTLQFWGLQHVANMSSKSMDGKTPFGHPNMPFGCLKRNFFLVFCPFPPGRNKNMRSLGKDSITALFPEKAIICAVSKTQFC